MSDISWVISTFHNSATNHGLVMNAEIIHGVIVGKNCCFLFTTGNVQIFNNVWSGKRYFFSSYRYPLLRQRSRSQSIWIEYAVPVPVQTFGVVDIYFLCIGGAVLWRVSKLGWHGSHCVGREWRPGTSHGPADCGRHHCQRPANCCLEVE